MMNNVESLNALVFAPHPDDAELGMGGTILKMLASNLRVGVVDLTRGELGTKGSPETRGQETRNASEILGLHHRGNLDLGDGRIRDTDSNRLNVIECIRKYKSLYVFAPSPFDRHPDHLGACDLISSAFFCVRMPKIETESPAFSPTRLIHYYIHDLKEISFVVDITNHFLRKLEAIRAYQSQFADPKLPENYKYAGLSDYTAQIEASNRFIGSRFGAEFAEAFHCRVPPAIELPTDLQ